MSDDDNKIAPADLKRRTATPEQQRELNRVCAQSRRQVARLIERAEREARAAGSPGDSVYVGRGWVVHPDDRGALKRRRR